MKQLYLRIFRSARCSALVSGLLMALLPVLGFSQMGVIRGQVVDRNSGEPVLEPSISVVGTYYATKGDIDGNFELRDVKPGTYTLKVFAMSYNAVEHTGVTVKAGDTVTVTIHMISAAEAVTQTVVIEGQPNLVDLESGNSQVKIGQDQIKNMNVQNVQDLTAMQAGVNVTPDGLQIRGGRVYETQYLVDGVSAQDPLAGNGFGLDVGSNAISELQVITGGGGAEFSGGTAGIVSTRIREGDSTYSAQGQYSRDNLGFNVNKGMSWNTDNLQLAFSGPLIPTPKLKQKLTFFASTAGRFSDEYYRIRADQLHSSKLDPNDPLPKLFGTTGDKFWAPRQSNVWNGTFKVTYRVKRGLKISLSNQGSFGINQSTRSLQVVGNNQIMTPGLQYPFALQPDNANTYTQRSNLTILNVNTVLGKRSPWKMDITAGRLFSTLRTDANGRPFRDASPTQIYDPYSIVTNPVTVYNPGDSVSFVNPGPGLYNNGGIATTWHDHYAEEYSGKIKFSYKPDSSIHYFTFGWDHKETHYQWIDVTSPWVGAPIQLNDSTRFSSNRIGTSNDIWKANPAEGGLFFQDNIRYKGIVATLGLRAAYWTMGTSANDAINNPAAPVLDVTRREYHEQNTVIGGRGWKARLLPKINVSFPVTNNNVLYFSYSHALRMPHPRFVYAGLDPVYQNRSYLSNLGNPNINPETTVSYELGLKTQLNKDNALTITAFYNDKFDFIVNRSITVKDYSGQYVQKSFYYNQDYARVRGLEVGYYRRIGDWFSGSLTGAYQLATGKSNSAYESQLQVQQTGHQLTSKERPLAWDRPFDFKLQLIFKTDSSFGVFKNIRVFVFSTYKSGFRYTPYYFVGYDDPSHPGQYTPDGTGRPHYAEDDTRPYAKIGQAWFWTDIRVTRDFSFGRGKYRKFIGVFIGVGNIFNNKNTAIINPITGKAWQNGDPVPDTFRDPRYPNPMDTQQPPNNPARYLQPRHLLFGTQFSF